MGCTYGYSPLSVGVNPQDSGRSCAAIASSCVVNLTCPAAWFLLIWMENMDGDIININIYIYTLIKDIQFGFCLRTGDPSFCLKGGPSFCLKVGDPSFLAHLTGKRRFLWTFEGFPVLRQNHISIQPSGLVLRNDNSPIHHYYHRAPKIQWPFREASNFSLASSWFWVALIWTHIFVDGIAWSPWCWNLPPWPCPRLQANCFSDDCSLNKIRSY